MSKNKLVSQFIPWGVMITLLSGLVYGASQQIIRLSANSKAAEYAHRLTVPAEKVELSTSLSPFVMIYDGKNNLVESNVVLDGAKVSLPVGVIEYARAHSEDRVSWQPRVGVRAAVVAIKTNAAGYVVAGGQSLSENENLISRLGWDVLIGWLTTLIITFFAFVFSRSKVS